jgi:hypothetical protein
MIFKTFFLKSLMYALHTSVLIVLTRTVPTHVIEHHVTAAVSNNLRTNMYK